ncbi:MAG: PadR family transcriptional regulator [Antricoccus sp.]
MAARETTMLVLGAVMLFEPVNGYQIRRELLSWGVEDWAHLNPGSVYSMLAGQAKQGHLIRYDIPDGKRTVAVYTSTAKGRRDFADQVKSALITVDPLSTLSVHTALTLVALLPRALYQEALQIRLAELDRIMADYASMANGDWPHVPDHIAPLMQGRMLSMRTEQAWVRGYLKQIEAGEFGFAGEPMSWQMADDDPGHEMDADRERYRKFIDGTALSGRA